MTLNGVIALILRFFSTNSIALLANYVTVVEDRPIISSKYCLRVSWWLRPVLVKSGIPLWPKLTHPAARSLCDSCATCFQFPRESGDVSFYPRGNSTALTFISAIFPRVSPDFRVPILRAGLKLATNWHCSTVSHLSNKPSSLRLTVARPWRQRRKRYCWPTSKRRGIYFQRRMSACMSVRR